MGLVVAACIIAGFGDMMHARAALLSDMNGASRSPQQLALQQKAETYNQQKYLDSTYSWVSPVDCRADRCIALTFDDGPNPLTTPKVLSILERERVTATFFVVGSRVNGNQALLRRMVSDGDEIGNHSWSHPDLAPLNTLQIRQQVLWTQHAVEAAGVPAPTLFRPPYGDINTKVVANVPLTIVFWNEDPRDWAAGSPDQIVQAVLHSAEPGGVIDMHDIYIATADSLPTIIQHLKAHNFHFVTTSQLLGLKPGQRGLYYGRP